MLLSLLYLLSPLSQYVVVVYTMVSRPVIVYVVSQIQSLPQTLGPLVFSLLLLYPFSLSDLLSSTSGVLGGWGFSGRFSYLSSFKVGHCRCVYY